MNVCSLTEADGVSWNHQEVLVCSQGGPDLTEAQCGTVGPNNDVIIQEKEQEQVESSFRDTKPPTEENEAQVPKNEISLSNSEAQQEPENREEAEDDEAEGTTSKPPSQAASGKKKKKKRKGKKKGGAPENKNQQTEKENGKTETNIGSAVSKNGLTVEPSLSGSVPETLKTSQSDQVRSGQENQEPTESVPHEETPQKPGMDPVSDELCGDEMSALEEDEAVGSTGTLGEEKDEDRILKPEKPGSAESAESFFNSGAPEEPGMDPVSGELCETRTTSDAETRGECAKDVKKKEETLEKTLENVESEEPKENSSHQESHQESITGLFPVSEELGDDVLSEEAEEPNQGSSDVGSVTEHMTVEGMGSETSPEPELDLLRSEAKLGDDISASGLVSTESETVDGPETSSESGRTGSENAGAPGSGSANISEIIEGNVSPPHEELTETSPESAPVLVLSSDSVHPLIEGPEEKAGDMSPSQDADELEQNRDRTENMDLSEDDGGCEVQSELNHSPDGEQGGGSASLPTQTQTGGTKNGPDGTERTSETETEVESSMEEPASPEDPEHNQEMDSSLCSLAEPELGSDTRTCEGTDSPQPPQLDGDEEEEGQSFDFDDLDIEAAEESSQSNDPKEQEVEQGAEVTSDDLSETHRNTEEEPADSRDQEEALDGGNRNSLTQEGACEEEEAADLAEEERDSIMVQENLNQKISLSVEEGLDAIQLDSDSPKNTEEAGSNKEAPRSKKSSKKGKGKGKEECKMS
uniref:Si:dkey-33i22.3 n=1 Tax=Iconisemion striatum TaxID=60296 RepID=A0A1A7X705_9TELE